MMTENIMKIFRVAFNAALILCAATGTLIGFIDINSASILSTFTTQSNLFCVIIAVITVIRIIKGDYSESKTYIFFKGMSLTSILLTFTIYNFFLKPAMKGTVPEPDALLAFADYLVHVFVPILMLTEYLLFETKGLFKFWYPFVWPSFVIYYIGYTAVYKLFGGLYVFPGQVLKFPYFFLDYETHGWKNVIMWTSLIIVIFIVFSFLVFGLDKVLVTIKSKRKTL